MWRSLFVNPVAEALDRLGVRIKHEDGELVATHSGDGIPPSRDRRDGGGHRDDHGVAGRVAKEVIDTLEVVEIDRHEGKREPVGQARKGALELTAIGEPGQRIGQRLLLEELVGGRVREGELGQAAEQSQALEETGLDRLTPACGGEDAAHAPVQGDRDIGAVGDPETIEDVAHLRTTGVEVDGAVDGLPRRDHLARHRVLIDGDAHLDGGHPRLITVRDDGHNSPRPPRSTALGGMPSRSMTPVPRQASLHCG